MTLTPKQERFVEEYLIDFNATRAALRAGYSEKGADPRVKAAIEAGKAKVSESRSSARKVAKPRPARAVDLPKAIEPPKEKHPIECPCCKREVTVPTIEVVIEHYRVPPVEARILGAVWRGKGRPVQAERIFDAMYADDPDGGPSQSRMYSAFKVALCHLRARLAGSGVTIENVGYRQGYRLVLGEK